jgi:putative heme degradation protein
VQVTATWSDSGNRWQDHAAASGKQCTQALQEAIQQRDDQGDAAADIYQWTQAEETCIQKQLAPWRTRMEATVETVEKEQAKQQRYREERHQKQQALAEITQAMADHPLFELDDRKDQLLSALRLCLTNVLQWLRDGVLPKSYANATYETLAPFVQMGGFVVEYPDRIEVSLDGFRQSANQ